MMSDEGLRAEYDELKKNLLHHRFLYDLGTPSIEDYEYDQLMLRLKEIEGDHPDWIDDNSPTQIIEVKTVDADVAHDAPMLSIDDIFSKADVVKFVDKIIKKFPEASFSVEEKVDGVSAALRYRDGIFERALSRGDGKSGRDITANVRSMVGNLVKKLNDAPPYIELRGEIFITRQNFESINADRISDGAEPFANPRNYTAGLMNSKDKQAPRPLSFVVHDMLRVEYDGDQKFETASDFYRFLEQNGVKVVGNKICRTAEEILHAIDEIDEARSTLDHALDGAVIKINRFDVRTTLGTTAKAPRWSIAYKFPPEIKRTVIRSIELNVGRTGRITPVAIFDPITLAGTTVSRATLHNKKYIAEKNIRLGSIIEVFKSGEIIPKVDRVVENPEGTEPYNFVEECPSCGAKLDMDDWRCINPNCPAQIENRIRNFVGKNAMDIEGLGSETIKKLIANGLIKNIADIYTLDRETLIEKCGFGPVESKNLIEAIEKSKTASAARLLTGLGIEGVGSTEAENLLANATSIERLSLASLETINDWVSKANKQGAQNLRTFFDQLEKGAEADINELLTKINYVDSKLAGRIIEVTDGSFDLIKNLSLEELSDRVSSNKALRNVYEFFALICNIDATDPIELLIRLKKVTRKNAKFLLKKFGSIGGIRNLKSEEILSIKESNVREGIRNIRVAFDQIDEGNNANLEKLLCTIDGIGVTYSNRLAYKIIEHKKVPRTFGELRDASYEQIINWGVHNGLKNIRQIFDLLESNNDPIELLFKIKNIDMLRANKLISYFGSIEKIKRAPIEELNKCLWSPVARYVREFFDLEENRIMIERLKEHGLNIDGALQNKIASENNSESQIAVASEIKRVAGGVIVFTGALTITREEAAQRAELAGFVVKNSITKSTDYLVVGEKPGSKLKKAEALGITILDEYGFNELLQK